MMKLEGDSIGSALQRLLISIPIFMCLVPWTVFAWQALSDALLRGDLAMLGGLLLGAPGTAGAFVVHQRLTKRGYPLVAVVFTVLLLTVPAVVLVKAFGRTEAHCAYTVRLDDSQPVVF